MEADFLRDYGVDLAEQLDTMTWRRFRALLNNLSPYGAVAARIRQAEEEEKARPKDDAEAAASFFATMISR